MMNYGNFVKVIGLTFDCLEGIRIIDDVNLKDHEEAGKYAEKHYDENKIFITIPCNYTYGK